MGMLFTLCLTGCKSGHSIKNTNQESQTSADSADSADKAVSEGATVLTLENIKERYTEEGLGKFVETYDYKNYILIEYLNPAGYQCFDLYNLQTGDRDVMLLGCNAEVFNFSSGDSITFKSDGTHQMSGRRYFPYYAVYTRAKEITGNETDFRYGKRELYKPISEGVEFGGGKNCESILDLKVTLMGLEIAFAPQKGREGEFYAGNIDMPVMKTSYDQNKNQLIIEVVDTLVNQELLKKQFREQNKYIDSVQIREKGLNSSVIITLKDDAKYYTAENGNSEEFPYVRFIFKKSNG
jgi:hypothetical protein